MKSIHNIMQKQSECKGLRFINYDKLNQPAKRAYHLLENNRQKFREIPKNDNEVNPQVDSENRVVSIEALIKKNKADRNEYDQCTIGHLGNLESGPSCLYNGGYNGGHLLCAEQGGNGTWGNMIPQEAWENQHGDWYRYERENTEKYIGCILKVYIGYRGDDVRPMSWTSEVINPDNNKVVNTYPTHYFNLDLPPDKIPIILPMKESDCLANEKKSRKKSVRWTKDEDMKLESAIAVYGTNNWTLIADKIPNRTRVQCCNRWERVLNTAISREPWTEEEDKKLEECVKRNGGYQWKKTARELGNRSDIQCRNRWNQLKKLQEQSQNYGSEPQKISSLTSSLHLIHMNTMHLPILSNLKFDDNVFKDL